ncbi:hypothetical protein P171DRAFT_73385 [Karstenula rhodostoma CBS 690.94]|uniref:Uncharacterized protein n=1 Tax=Karstenula rhodostoma CBS 690.94 TaxID=1392251 RepID=A0A9P4U9S2_9PLEO|nr:hypothetical protein P171DRAFT_73385 [Karstenula rhodostoma CBS 690.94]
MYAARRRIKKTQDQEPSRRISKPHARSSSFSVVSIAVINAHCRSRLSLEGHLPASAGDGAHKRNTYGPCIGVLILVVAWSPTLSPQPTPSHPTDISEHSTFTHRIHPQVRYILAPGRRPGAPKSFTNTTSNLIHENGRHPRENRRDPREDGGAAQERPAGAFSPAARKPWRTQSDSQVPSARQEERGACVLPRATRRLAYRPCKQH